MSHRPAAMLAVWNFMFKRIFRWLSIYEKEVGLFLWSMALLFIVRSAGVILNNYAETAFLKRYGVEFLPVVNMLNAVATVVIMGFVFGLIRRIPGPRLLSWQFVFCGTSIIVIRLLVPLGYDLIYPLLFMLKAQYEPLLAMLFWNLANDLFNTRQSKRLFPLITAGGVIGQILASFGTPMMARQFQFDNLLVVYLLITVTGAGVVWAMGRQFPFLLIAGKHKDSKKSRGSMLQEIKTVLPMLRSSVLMRIMILLTFMPNVVIPILNYQFNYAVDTYFASESSMIEFFGYFRGVLNIISLIILLFVGKIYGRWGLPVALMFHPFNYVIAFLAFLLRFDIIAAMYARMSTNILRTTINVPANAMMMGLFPESYRALVRPFLRGTVVRIALFVGSGLILISDTLFHPRYLSLVALPFVLGWLTTPFLLKKKYAGILIDLLQQNQLDLNTMKPSEVEQLFRGSKIQNQLKNALKESPPEAVLWYAQLLKQLKYPDLDNYLLHRIGSLDVDDQVALLRMISDHPSKEVIGQLSALTQDDNTAITVGVLQAMNRISNDQTAGFDRKLFLDHCDPEVRAYAAAGLFPFAPVEYGAMITEWIKSNDACNKKAGVIAAGASKSLSFEPLLRDTIDQTQTPEILAASIDSLHELDLHDLNDVVTPYLAHHERHVRLAAVSAFHVTDKESLNAAIKCLADADTQIQQMAENRIIRAHYVDGKTLIKALNHPNSALRERVFTILDKLQIKGLDLYLFARDQLEGAYKYLNESNGIAGLPANTARDLLLDHLTQQRDQIVRSVLRVLANQDQSRHIHIIRRGLMSKDRRQNANSQEALDDLLDKKISRVLIPLLEDDGHQYALAIGRQHYDLTDYQSHTPALLGHLLGRHDDWISILITLYLLENSQKLDVDIGRISKLTDNGNAHIRTMAKRVIRKFSSPDQEEVMDMDTDLALPDIVLKLKSIEIFEGLSVGELAAVASVTEDISYDSNEIVIKEGDPGDTLYLILEGKVAVIKTETDGLEVTLDHISAGDHFGEMALFEEIPRTATIRTTEPCRMLFLHKQEFDEMVREYPQIALKICKVFSGRIRKLHQRFAHRQRSSKTTEAS
jgi:hypothetical protein